MPYNINLFIYFLVNLNVHYNEQSNINKFSFTFTMNLKKIILRKLYRRRIIGGKHTAVEHLTKGLPKHIAGEAKEAVNELIKEGFILSKPTSYGLQVSLNPEKIGEIENIIEN